MLSFLREAPASWLSDVQNHLESAPSIYTIRSMNYDHSTRPLVHSPGAWCGLVHYNCTPLTTAMPLCTPLTTAIPLRRSPVL